MRFCEERLIAKDMENIPDTSLIRQLVAAARDLSQQPRNALIPFHDDIAILSQQFSSIAATLKSEAGSFDTFDWTALEETGANDSRFAFSPQSFSNQNMPSAAGPNAVSTPKIVSETSMADVLLTSASTHLFSASKQLDTLARSFDWFNHDERLLHLQPILTLQRKRRAAFPALPERLLLLCSCMSLASDF